MPCPSQNLVYSVRLVLQPQDTNSSILHLSAWLLHYSFEINEWIPGSISNVDITPRWLWNARGPCLTPTSILQSPATCAIQRFALNLQFWKSSCVKCACTNTEHSWHREVQCYVGYCEGKAPKKEVVDINWWPLYAYFEGKPRISLWWDGKILDNEVMKTELQKERRIKGRGHFSTAERKATLTLAHS